MGRALEKCGSLLHFGVFANQSAERGLLTTAASVISGGIAEVVTEKTGNFLLGKK